MVIDAAKKEGERPSYANLPRDGSMISRQWVDEGTGERSINWYGRRSFIHDPSRQSQRIPLQLRCEEHNSSAPNRLVFSCRSPASLSMAKVLFGEMRFWSARCYYACAEAAATNKTLTIIVISLLALFRRSF
jgi:hypothetical protein